MLDLVTALAAAGAFALTAYDKIPNWIAEVRQHDRRIREVDEDLELWIRSKHTDVFHAEVRDMFEGQRGNGGVWRAKEAFRRSYDARLREAQRHVGAVADLETSRHGVLRRACPGLSAVPRLETPERSADLIRSCSPDPVSAFAADRFLSGFDRLAGARAGAQGSDLTADPAVQAPSAN